MLIVLGMVADEAHGPVHVLDDFGNRVPRLAAVHDGEDRIAAIEQLADESRSDRVVTGKPAAAHDPDNARTIGIRRRREHVHRERHAEFSAVDDVNLALEGTLVLGTDMPGDDSRKGAGRERKRRKLRHMASSPVKRWTVGIPRSFGLAQGDSHDDARKS